MNKKDVYIPVSVEDVKNIDDIVYASQTDQTGKLLVSFNCLCLKPLKQVYVLTEDELREIYNQSHKEGQGFEEFIKAL